MVKNFLIGACILLFASCNKDNQDKIFGKWQMQKVEANGVTEAVDTIYYNFEHGLFMYQIYSPARDTFMFNYGFSVFEKENKVLLELTDKPGDLDNFIHYTDWASVKRQFTIDKLSVKELILSSEDKSYTFRKF